MRRIQDTIHGLMEFHGNEELIVDLLRTPELQRLKKIRQLGLAHLVFPGAEHSRFSHCLGAAYIAIKFGRHLRAYSKDFYIPVLCPDESAIRDIGIAALCHDLGHGPLSHAWEREIVGNDFNKKNWADKLEVDIKEEEIKTIKWHELVGHGFLLWKNGSLHKLLEQNEMGSSKTISDLLFGKYYLEYFPRILGSDIDVDRADFIKRDTKNTGVTYGNYDLEWLLSTCCIGQLDSNRKVTGFDEKKSIRVIEQFIIARKALYETVYHHKTVRAAEGMMALFLRRLKDLYKQGIKFETPNFVEPIVEIIKGNAINCEDLLKLDDFTLYVLIDIVAMSETKDLTVKDLAQRLRSRDLFKQVQVDSDDINHYLKTDNAKNKIYEVVEQFCQGESKFYVVWDEVKFKMFSTNEAEKSCLVDSTGRATYISEHPQFQKYLINDSTESSRLFTLKEAANSVEQLIRETLKKEGY